MQSNRSDQKTIWVRRNQRVHGPYTKSAVRTALAAGKLSGDDSYSTSENGPWRHFEPPTSTLVSSVEIQKSRFGGEKIAYTCPSCSDRLASEINVVKSGTSCPSCRRTIGFKPTCIQEARDRIAEAKQAVEAAKQEKLAQKNARRVAAAVKKAAERTKAIEQAKAAVVNAALNDPSLESFEYSTPAYSPGPDVVETRGITCWHCGEQMLVRGVCTCCKAV